MNIDLKIFKFSLLPVVLLIILGINMIPEAKKNGVVFQFDAPKGDSETKVGAPKEVGAHAPTLKDKQSWCKKDKDCTTLAEAGYYEARGESDIGVVSVLHTILNRVAHKAWPDSVQGVVYKPKHFSYTHDGSMKQGMNNKKQVERMNVLAYDVLQGLVDSPVGESTHYHSTKVNPYWVSDVNYIANVGNHKFYKGDR